jgi:D-alanyl-D-alanine carboxypeptidase/D-alanyl-D-alanine-endopeptidase (penicillin-binding protein 4)
MVKDRYNDSPFIVSYSFRGTSGKVIQSLRSNLPVLPASNMKILTGYVAYRLLGNNYEFITDVKREGHKITLYGGPSPLLDSRSLLEICGSLELNVHDMNDHPLMLKTKDERLDHHNVNPAWNYADSAYSYQPKITNFSLNENCSPKDPSFHDFSLQDLHDSEDSFIPVKSPLNNLKHGIIDMSSKYLEKHSASNKASAIHAERLEDILDHMETVSCNYSAEVLFKYLSYVRSHRPGSWENSSKILVDELTRFIGYDPQISVVDGSGLSRSNFLNTSFLSDLVMKIHLNGGDNFIRHLPEPGKGTLKNRLKSHQRAFIHAKTGSLTGVAALSGYIYAIDTSFSIVVNNYLGTEKMTSIIDAILDQFLSENEVSPGLREK